MQAFRMPKASDDEKSVRKQAIQSATRTATDAPLETLRTAAEGMKLARIVAEYGNPSAASDVRVALELLEATAAGATANVEVNLSSLTDEAYRKATAAAVVELTNKITEDAAAARGALAPAAAS
jgi:formiminotetrahydrofolate cyclodeaminase